MPYIQIFMTKAMGSSNKLEVVGPEAVAIDKLYCQYLLITYFPDLIWLHVY